MFLFVLLFKRIFKFYLFEIERARAASTSQGRDKWRGRGISTLPAERGDGSQDLEIMTLAEVGRLTN